MADLSLDLADETLILCPERAVYWPARRWLLVADVHWGKPETFRAHGLYIPDGSLTDDLNRLDSVIARHQPVALWVLGDLVHHAKGLTTTLQTVLADWKTRHPALSVWLIPGNHDKPATRRWLMDLGIQIADSSEWVEPFWLQHHPDVRPSGYSLTGHVHPAVSISLSSRQKQRLPCFWLNHAERQLYLPAFGSFTGCHTIHPNKKDGVFVVVNDERLIAIQPAAKR